MFRKSSYTSMERFDGNHRYEHWYRDNTVYFITARCAGGFAAFASASAKAVFWDRFIYYTNLHGFFPWVTSLLNNHYHTLGYLKVGEDLPQIMRKLHGSIAKLVNDQLEVRLLPFWGAKRHETYFDGCIRDEKQCRRAYRYTMTQSVRHGLASDWRMYRHTRVEIDLERGLKCALDLNAFLPKVAYARYQQKRGAPKRT